MKTWLQGVAAAFVCAAQVTLAHAAQTGTIAHAQNMIWVCDDERALARIMFGGSADAMLVEAARSGGCFRLAAGTAIQVHGANGRIGFGSIFGYPKPIYYPVPGVVLGSVGESPTFVAPAVKANPRAARRTPRDVCAAGITAYFFLGAEPRHERTIGDTHHFRSSSNNAYLCSVELDLIMMSWHDDARLRHASVTYEIDGTGDLIVQTDTGARRFP
ncbi:hypothetical protein GRZ55_11495 [Chelativorans sp. ZYF759]|uniref:hypothetical protein n=1 Tax=Chelativorans sp. ZYF759 TaxID=2692213 RepID=UPI00145CBF18|nr:hypothetical protein [Chelativorans sp. ZYF759]NMG39867.1 hypothetical protein [Chelativorans sp. ZYF759]